MAGVIGIPEIVHPKQAPKGIDKMGEGCRIASTVTIYTDLTHAEGDKITLGDYVIIMDRVRLVIGDTLANKNAYIKIGSNVIVNVGCYLSGEGGLSIEDNVLIGPGAKLLSAGHDYRGKPEDISMHGLTYGPIHIRKGAWIGAGAIILEGIEIGRGAVIGAGSVVTRDVPPFAVVAGNPARFLKWRPGFEKPLPLWKKISGNIKKILKRL